MQGRIVIPGVPPLTRGPAGAGAAPAARPLAPLAAGTTGAAVGPAVKPVFKPPSGVPTTTVMTAGWVVVGWLWHHISCMGMGYLVAQAAHPVMCNPSAASHKPAKRLMQSSCDRGTN
jgi:hypothetical protein